MVGGSLRTVIIKGVLDGTVHELVVKSTRHGCEYYLDDGDESIKMLFENDAFFMKLFNDPDMIAYVTQMMGTVIYEQLRKAGKAE